MYVVIALIILNCVKSYEKCIILYKIGVACMHCQRYEQHQYTQMKTTNTCNHNLPKII